jgi:pimeloyl-ACP methyl ester carboxylesterase
MKLTPSAHSRWITLAVLPIAAAMGCTPETGEIADDDAAALAPIEPEDAAALAGVNETIGLTRRATFSPCTEDAELECGQLEVPLDYTRPRGEKVTLATVRAAATGKRRGVIFVNPGGPGGSGVDFVIFAKPLFASLRESFDIVSFDPRGTARSQPVSCAVEVPAAPTSGTIEATAAFLDELGARYATACKEQQGALATQIGTNNVARDMDVLRAALGERELNYLGFSYGTILGASYATLFPGRVRAMVLDGNTPPGWFADYLLELDADGSAGAELALRRLDQICRSSTACPLRTAGVVATLDRVVRRLNANPVVTQEGVITGASVTNLVFSALYSEVLGWPFITRLLARVDAGNYAGLPAFPTDGGSTVEVPSTFAIVCDDSTTRRPGLDYLPAQLGNLDLYPRFGGVNFGLGISLCTSWPRPRVVPLRNLKTRHPVVLIGNDYDPATPQVWSRNMAAALGGKARLIRYQGGGHTIYGSGSACVDDAVVAYMNDLTSPPAGLTCPALPLAFNSPAAAGTALAAQSDKIADILPRVVPKAPSLPRR